MRILLTNDDGVFAPGLAALHAAVRDLGEVCVFAPRQPQSAAGHSITLTGPLSVEHVHLGPDQDFTGRGVGGSPADCVRLAIREILDEPVDLVLSGINAGANIGVNVFYSGTVAAAAEGAILGKPAVAFSTAIDGGDLDFPHIGRICRWVLDRLLADGLEPGRLVNVNVPLLEEGVPRGIRVGPQAIVEVEDTYLRQDDEAGCQVYRLSEEYGFAPGPKESDVELLAEGYVVVTPLRVDMTDHARLASLASVDWTHRPDDFR